MTEKTDSKGCIIKINVVPRSSRNQIVGEEAGVYKIKLTAPPVEGAANKALIGLLSKKLGLPKKDLQIISGSKSRVKIVSVDGFLIPEVDKLLK